MMLRIVAPPLPMTSRIFSVGIRIVTMRGAKSEISSRGVASVAVILSRISNRPCFA
ncbi:hypothetical protein D3C83_185140 [compost metagenome]